MGVLRIAGVALLACMLLLVVRELRPTFSVPVRIAATVTITGAAMAMLSPIVSHITQLLSASDAGELTAVLLRALGIALICELASSFCEDMGETGIARGVSLFGKLEILILCLPLLDKILELARELLKF